MEGVRPARPDDLAHLARLVDAAQAAVAGWRGGAALIAGSPASVDPAAAILAEHADPDHLVLAGTLDDAIVGVGIGRIDGRGLGGPTGIVSCCYVEPPARGVGVGEALALGLLAWFSERGCTAVDAPALPGDRSTKQLFERLGFSARLLVLHRRLT